MYESSKAVTNSDGIPRLRLSRLRLSIGYEHAYVMDAKASARMSPTHLTQIVAGSVDWKSVQKNCEYDGFYALNHILPALITTVVCHCVSGYQQCRYRL